MKFPLDTLRDIEWDDNYVVVETSTWEQDGKRQHQEIFFYEKNKPDCIYMFVQSRTGSPFTDWDYEYDTDMDDMVECPRVEKQEFVTYKWVEIE